jgi:hypothetical protein
VRYLTNKFKATFSEELIHKVVKVDRFFACAVLKKELTFLYGSIDFKGKSAYEILQWIHSYSMATTFVQMYKLANLLYTDPLWRYGFTPGSYIWWTKWP